jgi:hypothetical protein
MAQRKKLQKFSEQRLGLHRRQLFHWIGSNIEKDRKLSADQRTEKYIEYLELSLERGLWVKPPRVLDTLGRNQEFHVHSPICCFTETTLDEIEFHNREYGRLGLGFPKRFVLTNGGKPVNYINDVTSDPSYKAWNLLRRRLADHRLEQVYSERQLRELRAEFDYLSQFLKRIKYPYLNKSKSEKSSSEPTKKKISKLSTGKKQETYKRNYGGILHYLEEREWRIVIKPTTSVYCSKAFVRNTEATGPEWYLPYQPAKDLFTIVFPDNRTLAKALSNAKIRDRVYSLNLPPVTLLSLEDLGTF